MARALVYMLTAPTTQELGVAIGATVSAHASENGRHFPCSGSCHAVVKYVVEAYLNFVYIFYN